MGKETDFHTKMFRFLLLVALLSSVHGSSVLRNLSRNIKRIQTRPCVTVPATYQIWELRMNNNYKIPTEKDPNTFLKELPKPSEKDKMGSWPHNHVFEYGPVNHNDGFYDSVQKN